MDFRVSYFQINHDKPIFYSVYSVVTLHSVMPVMPSTSHRKHIDIESPRLPSDIIYDNLLRFATRYPWLKNMDGTGHKMMDRFIVFSPYFWGISIIAMFSKTRCLWNKCIIWHLREAARWHTMTLSMPPQLCRLTKVPQTKLLSQTRKSDARKGCDSRSNKPNILVFPLMLCFFDLRCLAIQPEFSV